MPVTSQSNVQKRAAATKAKQNNETKACTLFKHAVYAY
jgi:hypothetical protein